MRHVYLTVLVALSAVLAALGCESRTSVTGQVTFDGKKLERGFITFYPLNEQGQPTGARGETRGAEIHDGSFTVTDLSPGKRRVVVSVPPRLVTSKPADRAQAGVKALPPTLPLGLATPGNGRVVDLRDGNQTLDLALKRK